MYQNLTLPSFFSFLFLQSSPSLQQSSLLSPPSFAPGSYSEQHVTPSMSEMSHFCIGLYLMTVSPLLPVELPLHFSVVMVLIIINDENNNDQLFPDSKLCIIYFLLFFSLRYFIISDLAVLTNDSPTFQVSKNVSFLPFDIHVGKQKCNLSIASSSFYPF